MKACISKAYTDDKFTDCIPYVFDGSEYKEGHFYIYKNGEWVKIPNWKKAATRPTKAMTSNTSQGCVASASSEFDSDYKTWRAFDKTYSTDRGWASKASTNNDQWIQLKMDVPLKDIVVTLCNRKRADAGGPASGEFFGSDDGSEWTKIGSFEGRDGVTSSVVTVHECDNHNDAYQYVRLYVTEQTFRYAAIGEMYIDGKEAT